MFFFSNSSEFIYSTIVYPDSNYAHALYAHYAKTILKQSS